MSISFIVANKFDNRDVSVVGDKYFTDCTVSISHSFNNAVTEHPVEDGANISDHVQVQNNTFSVTGIFSNVQLNKFAGDNLKQYQERIKSAYQFLRNLRDNAIVFTLVSKYDVYENCVVSSLTIPVSVESSTNLYFELSVTQIRKAKVESVRLVQVASPEKKDDASVTSNDGKVSVQRSLAKSGVLEGKEVYNYITTDTKTLEKKAAGGG